MDINPLDYATQFTFPARNRAEIYVWAMLAPDKWMITDDRAAFTTEGDWIDLVHLDPIADIHKVAYDRDQALTVAHRLATTYTD